MTATYTTAADRDAHRLRRRERRLLSEPLLTATSCVAALAIALACAGRLRIVESAEPAGPIVNLNTVRDADALEPALARIFAHPNDRRFAADELLRFLSPEPGERRALVNVGAISRATVSTAAIRSAKDLQAYAGRVREADRRSGARDRIPLFTGSEIARLKPSLTVRTEDEFRNRVWQFGGLYLLAFHAAAFMWRRRGIQGDRLLLVTVHLLTAIGFAVLLSRPDPLRDTPLFVRYSETIVLGLGVMTALSLLDIPALGFASFSYLPLVAALSLSVVLILFGSGPGSSSAKVNLGPLQPIEGIRLLLALFLAGYFGRRWELLREIRGETIRDMRVPRWLNLPRAEYVLPVVVGVAAALVFFFFQKDLGPALFLCCVFLAVYSVARGRIGMAATGLALLAAGFYAGYRLQVSATLADRVGMWLSPWDNVVPGADQISHSLWAMASGGLFGTGLGLGDSRYLPAGHTDLILAAVGEELGLVGFAAVAVLFAVLAWRGFRIGRHAASDYGFFLAVSLTLFLILPALIMASGVLGITPLTGVVTPFLSYGGSAMLANFGALGLLAALQRSRRPAIDYEPFRIPMRNLGAVLGACALALVAAAVKVQVLRADELAAKPHLGIHADGGRRFEYNPRILDIVRASPRGTIFDRRGLPLASEDARTLGEARTAYERIGISLAQACPDPDERCYPLGGAAFHALGDARTMANWSATNTSYVERDADSRLRGYHDRAASVKTLDRAGRPMYTIHRDYRELVPVLRHRYQPDHAVVAAFRNRSRDVHLTLDADFQRRVAAIVAAHARRAKGRGAAVVLDPDTGAILATVSYPWPASGLEIPIEGEAEDAGEWIDRARYGAYPPGSTFKILMAVAAMREGRDAARYACTRLPDGRVGARIAGWTRPVRDDVLQKHPHGIIGLQEGLAGSCNAYFAQLAVALGPGSLSGLTSRARIPLAPSGAPSARIREMLPQIGYGQGQVLASPLRMAAVAGAIAADGVLRAPYIDAVSGKAAPVDTLVEAGAARRLAAYMREAAGRSTVRGLRSGSIAIAGKTGTAEVAGRDSHSWFVGFAPYGVQVGQKRIAFAVLVENAGYGALSAAPAAGDIVEAAAAAGVIGK